MTKETKAELAGGKQTYELPDELGAALTTGRPDLINGLIQAVKDKRGIEPDEYLQVLKLVRDLLADRLALHGDLDSRDQYISEVHEYLSDMRDTAERASINMHLWKVGRTNKHEK